MASDAIARGESSIGGRPVKRVKASDTTQWLRLETPFYISLEETLYSGQIFSFQRLSTTTGVTLHCGILSGQCFIFQQRGREIYYVTDSPDSCDRASNTDSPDSCDRASNTDSPDSCGRESNDSGCNSIGCPILHRFFNLGLQVAVSNPVDGLRFLTNEPLPAIFTFICSANNNINRITGMVKHLYSLGKVRMIIRLIGDEIWLSNDLNDAVKDVNADLNDAVKDVNADLNDVNVNGIELTRDKENSRNTESTRSTAPTDALPREVVLHEFPGLRDLIDKEAHLKSNGFGYRAGFICSTAQKLISTDLLKNILDRYNASVDGKRADNGPDCNSSSICNGEYESMQAQLMTLKGVGRKVADCICLMSLGFFHVVPIDTHIFKYSKDLFKFQETRLNGTVYRKIQELWRKEYGEYAGIIQLHAFKRRVDGRGARK